MRNAERGKRQILVDDPYERPEAEQLGAEHAGDRHTADAVEPLDDAAQNTVARDLGQARAGRALLVSASGRAIFDPLAPPKLKVRLIRLPGSDFTMRYLPLGSNGIDGIVRLCTVTPGRTGRSAASKPGRITTRSGASSWNRAIRSQVRTPQACRARSLSRYLASTKADWSKWLVLRRPVEPQSWMSAGGDVDSPRRAALPAYPDPPAW